MDFHEIKDKKDFQVYLEERARYKSLVSLYYFVENNEPSEIRKSLKSDFGVEEQNMNKAMEWLKELCSKKFILEDISHLLTNLDELKKIDGNIFFSLGTGVHKGMIIGDQIYGESIRYSIKSVKQIWKETEIIEKIE